MRTKYTSLQIGIHWLVFLLVIGAYAAMATFSRGLYLGFAVSVIVMGLGLLLNGSRDKRWRLLRRWFHSCS